MALFSTFRACSLIGAYSFPRDSVFLPRRGSIYPTEGSLSPYSPNLVELEFCELLRLLGILGSWHSSGPLPRKGALDPHPSPPDPTHRASSICTKRASKACCVGLGGNVWCIHSKHSGNAPVAKGIRVCASEKGKPVVRRGRKAHGPPSWEVAGLPNSAAGLESSPLSEEGGTRCPPKGTKATHR